MTGPAYFAAMVAIGVLFTGFSAVYPHATMFIFIGALILWLVASWLYLIR